MRGMSGLPFQELCRIVGKDAFYVRNLQRHLELPVVRNGEGYPDSYALFLEKVVALRAFHVSPDDIKTLFETEKKILRVMHIDTLSASPTWYLDGCNGAELDDPATDRLLLTGYRLGFPLDGPAIQHTLDFGKRESELFTGREMGEDLRLVLKKYGGLLDDLRARIEKERPVLENALEWARRVFRRG
jgi:hypothetical protein